MNQEVPIPEIRAVNLASTEDPDLKRRPDFTLTWNTYLLLVECCDT
jgi:hypothetical protein